MHGLKVRIRHVRLTLRCLKVRMSHHLLQEKYVSTSTQVGGYPVSALVMSVSVHYLEVGNAERV